MGSGSLVRAIARRLRRRHELAVVIPADAALAAEVRAVQAALRDTLGLAVDLETPPHVTLKLSFETGDAAGLEAALAALAAVEAPLELELPGAGSFREGIVFLEVAPSPALRALQARVLEALAARGVPRWPLEEEGRFHFHVTLARGVPAGSLEAARALAARGGPRTLRGEALALLRAKDGAFAPFRSYALGRPRSAATNR
ncbi:MAG: 2'-5' RNA ligase family protein [Anaeromyxobacter sp.]